MRPNPETFSSAGDAPRLPRVDLYGPVHKGLRWALTVPAIAALFIVALADAARRPAP